MSGTALYTVHFKDLPYGIQNGNVTPMVTVPWQATLYPHGVE
jgi:hypothetical protein